MTGAADGVKALVAGFEFARGEVEQTTHRLIGEKFARRCGSQPAALAYECIGRERLSGRLRVRQIIGQRVLNNFDAG